MVHPGQKQTKFGFGKVYYVRPRYELIRLVN